MAPWGLQNTAATVSSVVIIGTNVLIGTPLGMPSAVAQARTDVEEHMSSATAPVSATAVMGTRTGGVAGKALGQPAPRWSDDGILISFPGSATVSAGAGEETALTWRGNTMKVQTPNPSVDIDRSAEPFLTDRAKEVVGGLVDLLSREARRACVPTVKFEIRGWRDPEYGGAQIIVRQWVDLSPREAMDYWDSLSGPFDSWVASLSPREAEIALELVALEVEWTRDEVTV